MFRSFRKTFYTILYKILYYFGYRFIDIPLMIKGIGHQIVEPACLLKRIKLGLIPSYKYFIFFSLDLTYTKLEKPHINYHLLKYLKKYFVTLIFEYSDSKWEKLKFLLFAPLLYPGFYGLNVYPKKSYKINMRHDVNYYMSILHQSAAMFETNSLNQDPIFKIKRFDCKYGEKVLRKFGVPKNAWFVTFHYRDDMYYKKINYWESNYKNRCVDVNSYALALKEIIDRGGWCIRMGTTKSMPLPDEIKSLGRVIDIPHCNIDVDRITPYLLSQCKFFLGCNSGPSILPGFFGVPTVQVQSSPFYGIPIHHFDLFIFKKYWSLSKKRYLSIEEMCQEPIVHMNLDDQFEKEQIQLIDNSAEDIHDVVVEMFDKLKNNIKYSQKDNELQLSFKSRLHPSSYCFKVPARVGKIFLEKNTEILN